MGVRPRLLLRHGRAGTHVFTEVFYETRLIPVNSRRCRMGSGHERLGSKLHLK